MTAQIDFLGSGLPRATLQDYLDARLNHLAQGVELARPNLKRKRTKISARSIERVDAWNATGAKSFAFWQTWHFAALLARKWLNSVVGEFVRPNRVIDAFDALIGNQVKTIERCGMLQLPYKSHLRLLEALQRERENFLAWARQLYASNSSNRATLDEQGFIIFGNAGAQPKTDASCTQQNTIPASSQEQLTLAGMREFMPVFDAATIAACENVLLPSGSFSDA